MNADEQIDQAVADFPFKYMGGGMFRDARVEVGETAETLHGQQVIVRLAEHVKGRIKIYEAERLGYEIVKASAFEVGLTKKGRGIRTWFCQEFDAVLPRLDHPEIQKAISATESLKL